MNKIRCSSLPRIMACPASLETPLVDIDTSGDVAVLGTAVHEVLADIIGQRLDTIPDLHVYARKHDVEVDDLRFLAWRGMEIWSRFKPLLMSETVSFEREFQADLGRAWSITGHLDVCAELNRPGSNNRTLIIIDWKSGYIERDYNNQLMGYAWLADQVIGGRVSANGESAFTSFKIVTAWLRNGVWDVLDLTAADLASFTERLRGILYGSDRPFHPEDSHCLYCPRSAECPARSQLIQSSIRNLLPMTDPESDALTVREKLAAIYDQSQMLKRALEQYSEALRASIRNEGPLELSDGRFVSIRTMARDVIHFTPAGAEIIAPYLNASPTCDAVSASLGPGSIVVNKKRLIDVAVEAKRGEMTRKEITQELMTSLIDAGCVATTPYDALTVTKGDPLIGKEQQK